MKYFRWGYTSFSKLHLVLIENDVEYNLYRGFFKTIPDRNGEWEETNIIFWSRHPVLAMRAIVKAANNGTHPTTFTSKIIDTRLPLEGIKGSQRGKRKENVEIEYTVPEHREPVSTGAEW